MHQMHSTAAPHASPTVARLAAHTYSRPRRAASKLWHRRAADVMCAACTANERLAAGGKRQVDQREQRALALAQLPRSPRGVP